MASCVTGCILNNASPSTSCLTQLVVDSSSAASSRPARKRGETRLAGPDSDWETSAVSEKGARWFSFPFFFRGLSVRVCCLRAGKQRQSQETKSDCVYQNPFQGLIAKHHGISLWPAWCVCSLVRMRHMSQNLGRTHVL